MSIRPVTSETLAQATMEGAGVHLHRAFGFHNPEQMDPFLLFDDFRNEHPRDYLRGFPWHPHRGIETITYVLAGAVEHGDSLGNRGTLRGGDVQWMTAGSGVIHEEFHSEDFSRRGGMFEMVQLWVNLPAKDKNTPPRYQHLAKEAIPVVQLADEAGYVRVIAGQHEGVQGAATTFTEMNVWDVVIDAGKEAVLTVPDNHSLSMVVLRGQAQFNGQEQAGAGQLVGFTAEGGAVKVAAGEEEVKILLLSGVPIAEPVVGYGPFVMNTEDEIRQAIHDFNHGRFGRIS